MERGGSKWNVPGICFLLAVLVVGIYGQTLDHKFIAYDDTGYVYENSLVTSGLTGQGILQAFTQKEGGLWNPLVTVSHIVDWKLYGLWAGGHHLTNLLLHLASAILLFLILRKMTGAFWCSAFVAVFFAIHPLRVESVAWIAERKDVLSGLFFMLTLGSYLLYVHHPGSLIRYGGVVLCFGLGLMTKPMLVTLPFLLLVLDYWPLGRLFRDRPEESRINWPVVIEKIPLILLSLAICLFTLAGPAATYVIDPIPWINRMALAPVWVVLYLKQMIWPVGLAVIYPRPEEGLSWWPIALLLCGALSLGCFVLRRKHPYLWMGWLWNLGMLVPVLGIVQISRHSRADHYNYLPQIGLYIAVVWLVGTWVEKRRSRFPAAAAIGLGAVMVGTGLAWRQAAVWHDNLTLWKHAVASTKDNFFARGKLGMALMETNQVDAALAEFRSVLRLHPGDAGAHNNLGKYFFETGQTDQAVYEFQEALLTEPGNPEFHMHLGMALAEQGHSDEAMTKYREALRLDPAYALAHFKLGNALHRLERNDEAVLHLREAVRIDPFWAEAHDDLGTVLYGQGKPDEAMIEYRAALRLDPEDAQAHFNLGSLLAAKSQPEGAMVEWRETLRLKPSHLGALGNLGLFLLMKGNSREALLYLEKAAELQPENPVPARTLAAAYASVGDFQKALEIAQQALQFARAQGKEPLINDLIRDIERYRAGKPLGNVSR